MVVEGIAWSACSTSQLWWSFDAVAVRGNGGLLVAAVVVVVCVTWQ